MKIYLICPVRNATFNAADIVQELERCGHEVHWPPRDVCQDMPAFAICAAHRNAMRACDLVEIVWDPNSKGSHFDLGMAFALHKPVHLLHVVEESSGKNFLQVIDTLAALHA